MDATTQQDNRRRLIRMIDEILDDGDATAEARIAGARSHTIDGSDFDVSPTGEITVEWRQHPGGVAGP